MPKKKSIWLVTFREDGQIVSQSQTKGEAFRIARAKARELYDMAGELCDACKRELKSDDDTPDQETTV